MAQNRQDIRKHLVSLATVAIAAVWFAFPRGLPDPLPATAGPKDFSAARAFRHIEAVASRPHPIGSPANARARDYLLSHLEGLGLETQVQRQAVVGSETPGPAGLHIVAALPENVVARLKGTGPGKAFMLAAHYDSVPTAPGASDDGAGVATLLETARALKAGPPLKNDVVFLFTDGEEVCLCGSLAFVTSHPWAKDVGTVLNLEARGNGGAAWLFETSEHNSRLLREFAAAAPHPVTSSLAEAGYALSGSNTDLSNFIDAGMQGMNVAYLTGAGLSHYHTRLDNPGELDRRSLQHMGSYALSVSRHFGRIDLSDMTGDRSIFFSVSGTLVRYPQDFSIPLALAAGAGLAGVWVLGVRRKHFTSVELLSGFVAMLAAVAGAALASAALHNALRRTWTPGGRDFALEYRANLIWPAFLLLSFGAAAAVFALFGARKARRPGLAAGGLGAWWILGMVAGIRLPSASYIFVLPVISSVAGWMAAMLFGNRWRSGALVAHAVAALPAVVVFAPAIYGMTLPQGLYLAPLISAAGALLFGLLLPLIRPLFWNGWPLPAACTGAAIVLIASAALTSRYDARHPKVDSLFFAANADGSVAMWGSYDEQPDSWTRRYLGKSPQSGPAPVDLANLPPPRLFRAAGEAPVAGPVISIVDAPEDSVETTSRTARLRIKQPPGTMFLTVAGRGGGPLAVQVEGQAVPVGASAEPLIGRWTLDFWAPPPEGIEVDLTISGGGGAEVTVASVTPGLPRSEGGVPVRRPPDLMAKPHLIVDSSTVVSSSLKVGRQTRE